MLSSCGACDEVAAPHMTMLLTDDDAIGGNQGRTQARLCLHHAHQCVHSREYHGAAVSKVATELGSCNGEESACAAFTTMRNRVRTNGECRVRILLLRQHRAWHQVASMQSLSNDMGGEIGGHITARQQTGDSENDVRMATRQMAAHGRSWSCRSSSELRGAPSWLAPHTRTGGGADRVPRWALQR
eukprot:846488-Amphidinium_carterae.1